MDSELVKMNQSIEHHSISVWVMVLILVVLFFGLMFWRMIAMGELQNDAQHKQKAKYSILFVRVGVYVPVKD